MLGIILDATLGANAIILVTPHEEIETTRWEELGEDSKRPSVLIDGRAALDDLELESLTYTTGSGRM